MRDLTRAVRRFAFFAGSFLLLAGAYGRAQAALLMEQPYGVFGTLNPTGHAAIYLEHVCAETPVEVRECRAGETGVVISRYKGMAGFDWVAIPLLPYLYAVESPLDVPAKVTQEQVNRMREHYREARLGEFGEALPKGNFVNGGWTELVGTAYDRSTFAFRFDTTREQDLALIADLNERPNASHFNILFNNCADFDRFVLKHYFPTQFGRTIFPDAGITTPKHITYSLVKYAKKHPETELTVLEIPQVPGYRHESHAIQGVTESVIKNGYVIPIVVLNPYVAGGLFADYLLRGRYHLTPKNPETVDALHLEALTGPSSPAVAPALTLGSPRPENPAESLRIIPVSPTSGANGAAVAPALVMPALDAHEE
ncbi:MAG TPA: hypothetical protein VIM62_10370 [Acidobacteriaceae bacterium]